MKSAMTLLGVLMLVPSFAAAQNDTDSNQPVTADNAQVGTAVVVTPPPPGTHLEEIQRRTGRVLVRGYTEVASVRADDGTIVRVLAVELQDVGAEKRSGLAIEISPALRERRTVLSLVDEEEIPALLDALDQLSRLEHSATPLNNYEARFRTKGSLELANIDVNGTRILTVSTAQVLPASIQMVWATATFPLTRTRELQQQIEAAKNLLDRNKAAGK